MIKINLVPQEILAKEAQKQRIMQIGLGAGLFLVLVAGLSYWHYKKKSDLEAALVEAKAKMETLKDAKSKLDAAKKRQADVLRRREILQGLLSSRRLYPIFMSDMIDILPRTVYLESLSTTNTGPESLNISLGAVAQRPEDISDWLRVLSSTRTATLRGQFTEAQLSGGISIAETGDKFALTMKYALLK